MDPSSLSAWRDPSSPRSAPRGAGRRNVDTLFLEPLGSTEIQLIADRVAGGTLPAETRARVVETAGETRCSRSRWARRCRTRAWSPSRPCRHFAARLDRLGPAERDLLRSAAVVGADFTVDALTALVPKQAHPFVGRHLQALERKQLIRPARSGGQEFSFRHVLIQLAAYQSTTREDRARLHERFAEWLRDEAAERPPSLDEILGYHLEEARGAAGARDARRTRRRARRSSRRIPGRRGPARSLAVRRGRGRQPVGAGARAASVDEPGAADGDATSRRGVPRRGSVVRRRLVLAAMLVEAEAEADESLAQVARLERARLRLFAGPDPTTLRSIREEAERALDVFGGSGDEAGLASPTTS